MPAIPRTPDIAGRQAKLEGPSASPSRERRQQEPARRRAVRLPLLLASGIVLIVALFDLLQDASIGSNWHIAPSVATLLWGAVFLATTVRALGTPYSFGGAFVVMLILFHLGITVPHSLGIIDARDLLTGSLDLWLERATWHTVLGLSAFGVGYALGLRPDRTTANRDQAREALAICFRYGLGLLVAAAIFLALAIHTFGNLLDYSRIDFFRTSADTRGFGAFIMTFPAALVLLAIGAQTPLQRLFAYSLAAIGFTAILLSGYRSDALYPLFAGAILLVKTGRRIPVGVAIIGIIMVILSIPVIGLLRADGTYKDMSYAKVEAAAEESDWRNGLIEMGQTAGVLAHTLRLVPAEDPFRYGASYLDAILEALPNVSTTPSRSARTVGNGLSEGARKFVSELSPASWFTYRLSPQKFYSGEGLGFSAIAEAYLNFGTVGVVAVMALFGAALARLDGLNLLARPVWLLFCGAVLFHFLRTSRNEFTNFAKPFVFILIIFLVWHAAMLLLGRMTRRRPLRT